MGVHVGGRDESQTVGDVGVFAGFKAWLSAPKNIITGATVGDLVEELVGELVGDFVGEFVGLVGDDVGELVGGVGSSVGEVVGLLVG